MKFCAFLILILGFNLALLQGAFAAINIDSSSDNLDISQDFYKDSQLSERINRNTIKLGYFRNEKWLYIKIKNDGAFPLTKYFVFDNITGRIDRYDQGTYIETFGSSIPFEKRLNKSLFSISRLDLKPGEEKNISFKIKSRHNFNSKVSISNLETIKVKETQRLSIYYFYIGGILCLTLYNLFIFFVLKDINYLFYCFFSTSFLLAISVAHGLLDYFFQPLAFSFSHYLICFSSLAMIAANLFAYNFLEISTTAPQFKKYFNLITYVGIFVFLVGLTPLADLFPPLFGKGIDASILLANLFFIFVSIKLINKNYSAKFYLFSWVIVLLAFFSWFGMTFGFLPPNVVTNNSLYFANLGQLLILSLALANRIHNLNEDKNKAELRAMETDRYQRLVRVLSHDIANSLTIVHAYAKRLTKLTTLEAGDKKAVEKIYFSSENIKNILNNVREQELLATKKATLTLANIALLPILETSRATFEEQLKYKKMTIQIDVEEHLKIYANEVNFLNNIVNNIISNSIKFSYANSTITISGYSKNQTVCLVFKDTGKGIDESLIQDIFFNKKFHSTLGTNSETGNGFGTTLMREYVELFGGKIEVKSVSYHDNPENSGTTIILSFPKGPTIP